MTEWENLSIPHTPTVISCVSYKRVKPQRDHKLPNPVSPLSLVVKGWGRFLLKGEGPQYIDFRIEVSDYYINPEGQRVNFVFMKSISW